MRINRKIKNAWRTLVLLGAAGGLLATSCGLPELQAVSAGLEAAASHLDSDDDDISFGDWLMSEIND